MCEMNKGFACLKTPFEARNCESWEIYPRPQMKRESYISLSGEWELISKLDNIEKLLGKIKVPIVPESRISGIFRKKKKREKYIYKRNIDIPEGFNVGRILLHFGAVDQICKVFVNGNLVGEHIGG